MASIQLTGDTGAFVLDPENLVVQVKRRWADDWETEKYLQPISANLSIAPDISAASFIYHYGEIKREDLNEFTVFDPANLANQYVRIVVDDQQVFIGVIMDDQFDLMGSLNGNPSGDQSMTAYGLEHVLDRAAVAGAETATGIIQFSPAFNLAEKYGGIISGNRSAEPTEDGYYVFDNNDARWSNLDILRYIINVHSDFGFTLGLSGQFNVLADVYGVYWFEGLTIRQVIDKLVDRRRGLGWYLWSNGENVSVHIFTVFERDIGFANVLIPGNPDQYEFNMDSLDVQKATISQSQSQLYDRILVQGARAQTVFTLSVSEGNLVPAWNEQDKQAYINVDGDTNEAKDDERQSDRFEAVFQRFLLSTDWDSRAGNGNGGQRSPVLPLLDSKANIIAESADKVMQIRRPFLRSLPFMDSKGQTIPPLVLVKLQVDGADKWFQIDAGSKALKTAKSSVRMLDDEPGFTLKPAINHALAAGKFFADTDNSETDAVVDYETLTATVSIETDTRPTVVVDITPDSDNTRTLVLTIYDAEFWYATPNTVTGVKDGKFEQHSGGVLRDDTDKLRYLAALAAGWYSQRRSAVTLTTNNLMASLRPGILITSAATSWHKEPVGTVLSRINFDFENRTTTLMTGHAELDLQILLDIPGMSDFRSVGRAFNRQQAQIKQLSDRLGFMPVRHATASLPFDPAAEQELPAVDFIVDNFDRGDANGLGLYWANSTLRFQINNNQVEQLQNGAGVSRISLTLALRESKEGNGVDFFSVSADSPSAGFGKYYYFNDVGTIQSNTLAYYKHPLSKVDDGYYIKVGFEQYSDQSALETTLEHFCAMVGIAYSGIKNPETSSYTFDRVVITTQFRTGDYMVQVGGANLSLQAPSFTDDYYYVHPENEDYSTGFITDTKLVDRVNDNKFLSDQDYTIQEGGDYSIIFNGKSAANIKRIEPPQEGILYKTATQSETLFASSSRESVSIFYESSPFGESVNYNFTRVSIAPLGSPVVTDLTPFGIRHNNSGSYQAPSLYGDRSVVYSRYIETVGPRAGRLTSQSHGLNQVENFIKLLVTKTGTSVYLNDELKGSSENSDIVPGQFVGLISVINQLANTTAAQQVRGVKISSFKAWRADISEPLDDESGHGNYDAEDGFMFTDRYHSKDAEGEVIYNPTALDG